MCTAQMINMLKAFHCMSEIYLYNCNVRTSCMRPNRTVTCQLLCLLLHLN